VKHAFFSTNAWLEAHLSEKLGRHEGGDYYVIIIPVGRLNSNKQANLKQA
jgi:hypothetical protein